MCRRRQNLPGDALAFYGLLTVHGNDLPELLEDET
jgi:hypothetical protein